MKTAGIALGALGLSLALTACGSGSDSTSSEPTPTQDASTSETAVESKSTPEESDAVNASTPSPSPEQTLDAPEDVFNGEVIDLGSVEVSVGDRIGVPVPRDMVFGGDSAAWDFQLDLGTLVEQADLEREDVPETLMVADSSAEESTLIYDVVASGEGVMRLSFTNPDSGESTMLVVRITSS